MVVLPRSISRRSSKERIRDDQVMATNSSSIVSKRSVERLYYPDEPQFFRFFVKKFQRRAPLINRGYHLRLHVIDTTVRKFLDRPSQKTKVVVNLGCGSDVLPWQCMTRYPDQSRTAKFVDIDFPDLMAKKSRVVEDTPELCSMLKNLVRTTQGIVLLKSEQYVQIGCDLRHLDAIKDALSDCLVLAECEFLFVAEVSITYMETDGADAVIKWASTFGQCEFCLLEQILPDGASHPFAQTMLRHFEKLRTPLKSVRTYPTLKHQQRRFSSLGWSQVDAETLWQVWGSEHWVSSDQRMSLNEVEPFDEWEEFALFASHYCVVIAKTGLYDINLTPVDAVSSRNPELFILTPTLGFCEYASAPGQRRLGAPMKLTNHLGQQYLAHTFGLGASNRLRSYDLYDFETGFGGSQMKDIKVQPAGPGNRMCHTLVDLGLFGNHLIGGRTSPSTALRDCWLYTDVSSWTRVEDLPLPLFRHAATRLGRTNMTMVIGGKSDSTRVFGGCLLHQPGLGWTECKMTGLKYKPVFGAMLVSLRGPYPKRSFKNSGLAADGVQFRGILAGGLLEDGTVAKQILRWNLVLTADRKPTIAFESLKNSDSRVYGDGQARLGITEDLINRFGATALCFDDDCIAVIGGVIGDDILPKNYEIMLLRVEGYGSHYKVESACRLASPKHEPDYPRPLLVGTAISITEQGQLVMMGGGATCFSMGTFWNPGCYYLRHDFRSLLDEVGGRPQTGGPPMHPDFVEWKFCKTVEATESSHTRHTSQAKGHRLGPSIAEIPRLQIDSAAEFSRILRTGKPFVVRGADLGSCIRLWDQHYLVKKVGANRKIVVHEATDAAMDFNTKNFFYATHEFEAFMQEAATGGRLYLRALSRESPTDRPASLESDFPDLAGDFQLPEELSAVKENTFSSVLRVSGRVNMWLHYDVMANVYCQIVGSKRLVLFPPSDVSHLSFAPGASSSSIDVFSELSSPSLSATHPHETLLKPGDILYIPPLWLHTSSPLSDLGIAVNVFFRNLESGYAVGRDVYGNRDLAAYERGRQDIARVAKSFGKLPPDMRDFYLQRLAEELAQKAAE
ncbi:LCM-domain-containing protein [Xylariomycetidae sp. FL2044]|nr:LCM-domain-containing protein [Xylariomycetidae sp. FL2044]